MPIAEVPIIKVKEDAKESTQRDFDNAVKLAEIFRAGVFNLDRKLFDFKMAFAGFLGIVLTIIFTNLSDFNIWFPRLILVVTFLTFVTLFFEIWREAQDKVTNLDEWENEVIMMANIRHIGVLRSDARRYGLEAEKRNSENNKLYQAMKAGKTLEEIIKELGSHTKWRINMAWWGILFISVPVIFLFGLK
jgi:hypothetical protein